MHAGRVWVERQGAIATLVIDRPEKRNALDGPMWEALGAEALRLHADPPRVLILRGEGEHFSAGMDLSFGNPLIQRLVPAMAERDAEAARAIIEELKRYLRLLATLPCPVIAAIEGACAGGALEVALTADLRVGSETAFFAMPELRVGLAPDVGGTTRLSQLVGRARATELILTGRRISAQTALGWGLLNEVCAAGGALVAARALAEEVLTSAPIATRAVLPVLRMVEWADEASAEEAETRAGIAAIHGGEVMEGAQAFLERRKPSWAEGG